eukprot:TRINITY_DN2698_c0_g1_i1.p1 TRINITY_DN2698_c0_g1~~TRINITY_DN2698_c0_g1_i1.p1  ORF type:complete len:700 (+),score=204.40 TRINITY_DN2698_c0_g1_i1:180-2279(+)
MEGWRLKVENGRQVWEHSDEPNKLPPHTIMEKYALGLNIDKDVESLPPAKTSKEAANKGIKFYSKLQSEDGHWAYDYGGPMFLLPGLIITCYIAGYQFKDAHKKEMIRYLLGKQLNDGGWGLHIESKSTIFGTALNYVTLRILGMEKDAPSLASARDFLKKNGGTVSIPSWGKFWLATMNLYSWEGLNPLTPELWLLPYWIPAHPGRFWCHCRMVYLPMSYVYGKRFSAPLNPLIKSLREELYPGIDYNSINWSAQKWNCNSLDLYVKPSWIVKFVFGMLSIFEKVYSTWLRKKSLDEIMIQVTLEDESTKYIDIGPVNKAINALCVFIEHGKESEQMKKHINRVHDYLWLAEDGMKMQGYNGSQLWDTAFSVQAIVEAGIAPENMDTLKSAESFLDNTQVTWDVENNERYYRHISKGAWPFSTKDHSWPISDCTSEGLLAVLDLRQSKDIHTIDDERLYQAVNVILSLQNNHRDGGWATYENQRGSSLLEWLNPSETFGDIIVDYSYVETTSSCIQALCKFRNHFPNHRTKEVNASIARGVEYIKRKQRSDGSWIGSWGVCFTYGIWFGVEALVAAGESPACPAIKKACQFLATKQRADGGWGEDFQSCVQKRWVENSTSQTVNTSWALLALMRADWNKDVIDKGIKNLMEKQLPNGDWKQESISGVFNANCAISYSSYKNVFSIWALGRYSNKYESK